MGTDHYQRPMTCKILLFAGSQPTNTEPDTPQQWIVNRQHSCIPPPHTTNRDDFNCGIDLRWCDPRQQQKSARSKKEESGRTGSIIKQEFCRDCYRNDNLKSHLVAPQLRQAIDDESRQVREPARSICSRSLIRAIST